MVDLKAIKIGDTIKYRFDSIGQVKQTGKIIDIVNRKSMGGHTIFHIDNEDEVVFSDEVIEIVG